MSAYERYLNKLYHRDYQNAILSHGYGYNQGNDYSHVYDDVYKPVSPKPSSPKYHKEWENDKAFKGWLTKSKKGEKYFHCTACNFDGGAWRGSIKKHAAEQDHKCLREKQLSWSIVSKKTISFVLLGLFIYNACIKRT